MANSPGNPNITEVSKETQFQPGESGNPSGRTPGTRNLASVIKRILEDGELDWDKVPIKNADEFKKQFGKNGWDAIVYVAVNKSLSGDMKAAEWLRKSAYGNRLSLEVEPGEFEEQRSDMAVIFGILRRPTANEPGDNRNNPADATAEA